ncbi:MAG TPA: hypothetical protein VF868_07780 [Bacteroidia bacterium]|jgi:hypothetical protein
MQILIKLYKDQTPRIGIIYPSEYQAAKSFEQLLNEHREETFHAAIELVKGAITLSLKSVNGSGHIVYKDLEFKVEQLKRLQAFCKNETAMEFVHVYKKATGVFIPKIRNKAPELIKISGYEIVY